MSNFKGLFDEVELSLGDILGILVVIFSIIGIVFTFTYITKSEKDKTYNNQETKIYMVNKNNDTIWIEKSQLQFK